MALGKKTAKNGSISDKHLCMKNTAQIDLGNGKFALVSPEDYEYLSQYSWHAQKASGKRTYELWHAFTPVTTAKKVQAQVGMHRVVLARMTGDPIFLMATARYVDHINLDGLDNRRENLRTCTNTENQMNKRLQRNNTTGFKGVQFNRQNGKYIVRFYTEAGKRVYGGQFETVEAAALKYNEMAIQHFGRFALLNDVEGGAHRKGI